MIARKSILLLSHAPAARGKRGLLLLSPRWAATHFAAGCRLRRTSVHRSPSSFRCLSSSPPGGASAEDGPVSAASQSPATPPQQWKLLDHTKHPPIPVSLEDYVALGPGYRPQQPQRQQQHPVLREPTAPVSTTSEPADDTNLYGGSGSSTGSSNARRQRQSLQGERREEAGEWLSASLDLAASLGVDPSTSTEAHHRRIFHLYLPVYFWLKHLLSVRERRPGAARASLSPHPGGTDLPLVAGISAPQGCGKSTLVSEMQRMLKKAGYRSVVVSIDDFYLTGAEQDALAATFPTNPLLQVRGNAGTHDLALALRTIRALVGRGNGGGSTEKSKDPSAPAQAVEAGAGIRIPRYDKSARGGKGDRAPDDEWGEVRGRPDIVLLEGWMLGFEALPEESSLLVSAGKDQNGEDNGLGVVNTFLKAYRELHDEVDAWLVLKTAEPEVVFEWRAEAERRMREAGRPGMSEEDVRDFCSRYMPAYRAYLPGLYESCRRKTAMGDGDDRGRCSGDKNMKQRSEGGGVDERELVLVQGTDDSGVLRVVGIAMADLGDLDAQILRAERPMVSRCTGVGRRVAGMRWRCIQRAPAFGHLVAPTVRQELLGWKEASHIFAK